MKCEYAAYSAAGGYRPINEDNVYLNGEVKAKNLANFAMQGNKADNIQLFAVFDGMGGENAGETAAYISASLLKNYQKHIDEEYQTYFGEASHNITSQVSEGMISGCTAAVLSFKEMKARSYNLGDSRVYLLRNNEFILLSKDHTEYAALLDYGVLSEEEYYTSPTRNNLTRHLGGSRDDVVLEPYISGEYEIKKGDLFLLCSDGLCGILRSEEMIKIMKSRTSLLKRCIKLANAAYDKGGNDNVTAIIVSVK